MDAFLKRLDSLTGLEGQWGLTEDAQDYADGTDVHLVGAVHEFGTERTPRRPVFSASFDARLEELKVITDKIEGAVLYEGTRASQGVQVISQFGASNLKRDIGRLKFVPLAESTINEKGHDTELIRTGHMKSQIGWKVKEV